MKNKIGEITAENTFTVIIAVVGLALLFFGASELYAVVVNQEEENAKNFINIIEEKIDNLNDRETAKFQIRGVEDWFLTGWSKDDPVRPIDKIECFLDSCICICRGEVVEKYYFKPSEISTKCEEQGICKKIDRDKININSIIGTYISDVELKKEQRLVNYIPLPKNLIELEINKTALEIIITKNE